MPTPVGTIAYQTGWQPSGVQFTEAVIKALPGAHHVSRALLNYVHAQRKFSKDLHLDSLAHFFGVLPRASFTFDRNVRSADQALCHALIAAGLYQLEQKLGEPGSDQLSEAAYFRSFGQALGQGLFRVSVECREGLKTQAGTPVFFAINDTTWPKASSVVSLHLRYRSSHHLASLNEKDALALLLGLATVKRACCFTKPGMAPNDLPPWLRQLLCNWTLADPMALYVTRVVNGHVRFEDCELRATMLAELYEKLERRPESLQQLEGIAKATEAQLQQLLAFAGLAVDAGNYQLLCGTSARMAELVRLMNQGLARGWVASGSTRTDN